METNQKITFVKNMNKLEFNNNINIAIDNNVNVKTILNVYNYLTQKKIECLSNKFIFSGKICLKVLYVDNDNCTNTITDEQDFTESFTDTAITADCFINLSNLNVTNKIISTTSTLKINCQISADPILYINLPLTNNLTTLENLITKQTNVESKSLCQTIDTSFNYTTNYDTKDAISKLLCYHPYCSIEKSTAFDGYILLEGKIYAKLIYETSENGEQVLKELCEAHNFKTEVQVQGLTQDCDLDLSHFIYASKDNISSEQQDDTTTITATNTICLYGIATKTINLEIVDDLYSLTNETELIMANREYNKSFVSETTKESISGEINLQEQETAIDEIISNLNINAEMTNTYVKDGSLVAEGIVSSWLIYIDENKEFKSKQTELPFILDLKIPAEELSCQHIDINLLDSKVKAKRGTIIELDYTLQLSCCLYQKDSIEYVDNFNIGKQLDYSNYDYQIFLSRPNETTWELCKRIKTTPQDLAKYNKDLPLTLTGTEKILVKR